MINMEEITQRQIDEITALAGAYIQALKDEPTATAEWSDVLEARAALTAKLQEIKQGTNALKETKPDKPE